MKSTLTDLAVHKHHETDKAVLVSDDGDRTRAVWIPKSKCELEPLEVDKTGKLFMLTLDEALAQEKRLI